MGFLKLLWNKISAWFSHEVPALEAWVSKFLTDEGHVLLVAAEAAALDVLNGKSIKEAADGIALYLKGQGIKVALNDVLDAIRTQLSYHQAKPAETPPIKPPLIEPSIPPTPIEPSIPPTPGE